MVVAIAKLNYLRMSPRKVIPVARAIKKLPVKIAEKQLIFNNKKSAKVILKLLRSAVANAKSKGYEENSLFIKNIIVNQGPNKLKRYYPKARGNVGMIIKRMSHIKIELDILKNAEDLNNNRIIKKINKKIGNKNGS